MQRVRHYRAAVRNNRKKETLKLKSELNAVKSSLSVQTRRVRELENTVKEIDESCCQLEEEYMEANEEVNRLSQAKVTEVLATKEGQQYTNEIRELYYHLLAQQMPPSKIEQCIKTVLQTFTPGVDISNLQFPKASLAAEMRSLEMPTISASHQAHLISSADQYHLNSDRTTLNQKKVQRLLMNGIVLGVNDVVDGSAKAAVDELGRALQHIREIGLQLDLPGAEKIGWALIETSMSDQASTQKVFNRLVQEKAESERKERITGSSNDEQKQLLQLFCGMHLGVNL